MRQWRHLWGGLAEYESGGVWNQVVSSVSLHLASVTVKMFSHFIYFKKKHDKFYIFSVISKDLYSKLYYCSTQKARIPVNSDVSILITTTDTVSQMYVILSHSVFTL
jgi:hypothetical protein